jgi:hypothetical protein
LQHGFDSRGSDDDEDAANNEVCAKVFRYVLVLVVDNNKGKKALAAFQVLKTLIANAVDPGQGVQTKKVRVSNPTIQVNAYPNRGWLGNYGTCGLL